MAPATEGVRSCPLVSGRLGFWPDGVIANWPNLDLAVASALGRRVASRRRAKFRLRRIHATAKRERARAAGRHGPGVGSGADRARARRPAGTPRGRSGPQGLGLLLRDALERLAPVRGDRRSVLAEDTFVLAWPLLALSRSPATASHHRPLCDARATQLVDRCRAAGVVVIGHRHGGALVQVQLKGVAGPKLNSGMRAISRRPCGLSGLDGST